MLAKDKAALILSIAAGLVGITACSKPEILPASELREKHQLTADHHPDVKLNASNVPSDLVDLIPLAEKWGIGDDLIREHHQARATDAEKQALAKALKGRNARITEWLNSQPQGTPMSDEAAAFMYMQLGLDEMGIWTD